MSDIGSQRGTEEDSLLLLMFCLAVIVIVIVMSGWLQCYLYPGAVKVGLIVGCRM